MSVSENRFRTVRETEFKLNCCHAKVYDLLNTGKLRAVKFGRRTLIDDASIDEHLASLPPYRPLTRAA